MIRIACVLLFGTALVLAADRTPEKVEKLQYNRDVRPILAENCFACHGADSAARKARLRLDDRESAIDRGAIDPGKPDTSELVTRIFLDAGDRQHMPPAASHKTLKPAQKEILRRWIAEGAEYQPHWSFIAPKRPEVPKSQNPWARNAIDHFVLAEMTRRGLEPNPEADRRTLARRLALDLTGLPPEPADVDAFVRDTESNWYEKYVDKLMASPHWGEHRGRYWLDAARYGDTHGIHFDNYREMWSYRDWVIAAFNSNQRFDQFTIEQLAGDLLPNPTLEQRIATGFNRCNITTNEGGIIDEEYAVLYTRDRTETASQVFMGLTVGCAVCHDHKYDPVSQKDFYALAAFFNNTTQPVRDGNVHNTPPILVVPRPEDRAKWDAVSRQAEELRGQRAARKQSARGDHAIWLKSADASAIRAAIPTDSIFHAALDDATGSEVIAELDGEYHTITLTNGYALQKDKDGVRHLAIKPGESIALPHVGDFATTQPFTVSAWVKLTKRGQTGAILARMDESKGFRGWDLWIQGDRVASHIIDTWQQKAVKVIARTPLETNKWTHVAITYDGSAKAAGTQIFINGVPQAVDVEADSLSPGDDIRTQAPFKIGQRNTSSRVTNISLEDVRIFARRLTPAEVDQTATAPKAAAVLRKAPDQRSQPEKDALFDWWLRTFDAEYARLDRALDAVAQEEAALKRRGTIAHVTHEKPGMPEAYVLHRGEYDQRREKLAAATPKSLPAFPDDFPKNRLGLAKWLLSPEHPLTARVTVNRFWQELFGTGLVRTSGDFGIAGELPSHPELLDWLAVEFRESGWDVKKFFKLMVTSATYRQSAAVSKVKLEHDPANTWLARGPRFRMDAEMVRDYALAASGLLVRKIGGPSVKPYQPDGVWEAVAMIGSNTRDYKRDQGENLYRRSVYTFWKRAAPPASMEVLNAPNRETCAVKRERTNTPLQALLTLNDVQFVEAARVLAEKTLKHSGNLDERLDFLAKRLLTRPLHAKETEIVQDTLLKLLQEYRDDPDSARKLITFGESKADPSLPAPTLAAWTMLTNQLLNLDEVLNK